MPLARLSTWLCLALPLVFVLIALQPEPANAQRGGTHFRGGGGHHGHFVRANRFNPRVAAHIRQGGFRGHKVHRHGGRKFSGGDKVSGGKFGKHFRKDRRRDRRGVFLFSPGIFYGDGGYPYPPPPAPTVSAPKSEPVSKATASDYVAPGAKWISLGPGDGGTLLSGSSSSAEQRQAANNCLSVKTKITVEGTPMDAYGKSCKQADGTWSLSPAEPGT